jgi:hypothetical protein
VTRAERIAAAVLGYAGALGLLLLQRPWQGGDAPVVWTWAGLTCAVLLGVAGLTGHRRLAVVAAVLVAAAPWDFAYPAAVPFLVLAVVLAVRRR